MKISLKWLNDFVDVQEFMKEPQILADALTRAGLEVEDIQNKAKDFENVVVGLIKSKDRHPNADKLSLCQVEVAGGKIEQIVCGAQNHKAGDKVIAALPGAILPGNFAIKKSKIRDIESNGMLCSYKELGLAETSDGIAILPESAPVGVNFAEFGGYDDIVMELKVTPNRADCLSHYGLAREIGCLLGKPVKEPEVLSKFNQGSTQEKIGLQVLNSELCPRYCGRFISGVKVGPSPLWLKKRLESVGQNSINNVVDVTNYVMLEMGQPLHAFDASQIKGSKIIVRQAKPGEKFKTLKEQEVTLLGDELLICDSDRPVALAGVIGGLNSGVSEATTDIFLESANFQAMPIRKASRLHGIETDSAYRFARGVDASSTATIMDRAALLIVQVAGGTAFGGHHDFYPRPITKSPIAISIQTVTDRLGYVADENLFVKFMRGLQVKVETKGRGHYLMTPPLFRFDLELDMDLVEEYARLHGYENIQETIPALKQGPTLHDQNYMMNQRVSLFMRSEGFHQAFNYSFSSELAESRFIGEGSLVTSAGLSVDATPIFIKNPLSEELNSMRRVLSFGLFKNAVENVRNGNSTGQLFEIGPVFSKKQTGYSETRRLSIVSWGDSAGIFDSKIPNVLKIKTCLEKLFQTLQISAISFVQETNTPEFLHSGQSAKIVVEGQAVGIIGTLHPGLLEDEKFRFPMAVAEIDLDLVLKGQPRPLKFKSLSRQQMIERDFAFVMSSNSVIGELLKEIKKACGSVLREVFVFDIYEGDKLDKGMKSVALRVNFQGQQEPLDDVKLQELSQKLIDAAKKSVGAQLR